MSENGQPDDWTPGPLVGDPLPIVVDDPDFVVINKPGGMTVHRLQRAGSTGRHVVQTLSRQLGEWVYPVHRLDRPTSGALIVARSSIAARELQDSLSRAQKHYITLVRGETPKHFVSDRPLSNEAKVKQDAHSSFEHLAYFSRCSLLRVSITTGRRHQIRRHLQHLAHQIIGDTEYGKGRINQFYRDEYDLPRLVLHAQEIVFEHPKSQETIRAHVPLADDLREFLLKLPDAPIDLINEL